MRVFGLLLLVALAIWGCPPAGDGGSDAGSTTAAEASTRDVHSFARPDQVTVEHLDLDLEVDFDHRILIGRASLRLREANGDTVDELILDTRGLDVERVTRDDGDAAGVEADFELGEEVPFLGRPLTIAITPSTEVVHVDYRSRPEAAAVQWLDPEQTAGKRHPFLFTQSQAILARTWVPCQDTPAVRFTYDATVRVPPELMALMSAENPTEKSADGVYRFRMPQPIPSYLLALAVGDLEFRSLGPQTGVYAEPEVIARAAWEFAETEDMIAAAEKLYGPYRWGRYDILVLPPSFPFGGMENPRLTFATPTILAGDRSLVALVAHELAHSWSGNLVTNATWNDFWLNEGFTVYLERRIMEEVYGRPYAEMLALLGRQDLDAAVQDLGPASADTHLALDLAGRDPDDGMTNIAYEKGYFLLRRIEEAVGRERFDAFLRDYFDRYAFRSLTTAEFVDHLRSTLLAQAELGDEIDVERWVYQPGVPSSAPVIESEAFSRVDAQIGAWTGGTAAETLATDAWTTHEWLHFLRGLPDEISAGELAELDAAFVFTESGNSEILAAWLDHVIANGYRPADAALERFLTGIGRRKFLDPLYRRLAETEEGLEMAREIYARARPTYHPLAVATIDEILGWE
ncbi:MAG: M1 family metallopeptidase [Thermoanaerobaculia bacterium]